jgi:gamma-glutamylcyclotransferase (GGCT)/AIG2-like uncharacterized protein YtfP
MKTSQFHSVFVYGTLKTGECNHHFLKGLKGIKATAEGIVIHAGRSIPFAVRGDGTAAGEVYEADDSALEKLDALEDHPRWYCRELTRVKLSDGREIQAWIYLNEEARQYPQVPGNDWRGKENRNGL